MRPIERVEFTGNQEWVKFRQWGTGVFVDCPPGERMRKNAHVVPWGDKLSSGNVVRTPENLQPNRPPH